MRFSATGAAFLLCVVSGLVFLTFGSAAKAALVDDLVAYWAFDDGSGPVATDSFLGTHIGTLENGTVWAPGGKIGGAIQLDGSDDYVNVVTLETYFNGASAFTLSTWIKSDATGQDRAFFNGMDPNDQDRWGIRYDDAGATGGGDDVFKAGLAINGTTNTYQYESSPGLQTTNWQHVVMTWESNTGMQLWVDGMLDVPTADNFPGVTGTLSDQNRFILGDGSKANWQGLMDETAVWTRALTPVEVAQLYNGGAGFNFLAATVDNTLIWDGTPAGSWADPNWIGGAPGEFPEIIGTEGDEAIINSGAVTVAAADRGAYSLAVNGGSLTIGPGRTLTLLKEVTVAAGASFTMEDGATLVSPTGSLVGVTTHGNTAIEGGASASHLAMDAGATFTKAGRGTLSFDQSAGANVIDNTNTVQVTGGELRMQGTTNPLSGGDVVLDGGTFTVEAAPSFQAGLLAGSHSGNVWTGGANPGNLGIVLGPQGMFANGGPNDALREAHWQAARADGGVGPDDTTLIYTGEIFLPAGPTTFVEQNDDKTRVWVDGNLIVSDDDYNDAASGTFDAPVAGWYDFEVRFSNGGGGYGFTNQQDTGAGNVNWDAVDFGFGTAPFVPFNPKDALNYTYPEDPGDASLFRFAVLPALDMSGTDVTVLADSILNAITDETAAFGGLAFGSDATLATSGAPGGMSFTGTTFGPGVTAVGIDAQADTDPGIIDDGGVGMTVTKSGPARLILNNGTANTLGAASTFNVVDGSLVVVLDPDNPLRDASVELGGGTLALSIASGTAGDGGTLPFDKPLTVTGGNSGLTAGQHANGLAGPKTIVVGSATDGFDLTGGDLTVTTTDGYSLEIPGLLTGGGGLIIDGPNVTIGTGGTIGRFGIYAGATGLVGKELVVATNRYDFTDVTIDHDLGTGADAAAEVHIGNDDVTEAPVILNGTNAYSGMTRIRRGVLRADEGQGLPVGSLLYFDSNNNDQIAVLETSGTFTRNVGNNPGEVYWQDRGGFAARGGDLIVTLEGGADLDWTDGDLGFRGQEAIQFGSLSADGMVELTNNIDLGNGTRRIQVVDNPDVKTDFVRLSGNISATGSDNGDQFRFNENSANDFFGGLVELLGTNTYDNRTRIDDATVFAIEGVGLPVNSNLRFDGNSDNREAIFMSNGVMNRNIGNNAGEVSWDGNRGGFAARGGPFTVTLEGGATLNWGDVDTGFEGHHLQLGSKYADDVVTLTNTIQDNNNADRYVHVWDNPDVDTDWAVMAGDLLNIRDFRVRGTGLLVLEGTLDLQDDLEVYDGPTFEIQGGIARHGTEGDDDFRIYRGSGLVLGPAVIALEFDDVNVEDDSTAEVAGTLELDDLGVRRGSTANFLATSTLSVGDDINVEDDSTLEILGALVRNGSSGDDDINVRRGSTLMIGPTVVGTDFDEFNVEDDSFARIEGTLRFDQDNIFIDDNSRVEVSGNLFSNEDIDVDDGGQLIVEPTGSLDITRHLQTRRGALVDIGGTVALGQDILVDDGARMIISGTVQMTTGDQDVVAEDGGTLVVNGSLNNPGDDLIVRRGGSTLGGTGSISVNDDLNIEADARLAPGDDGVGTLSLQAGDRVRMYDGSTYEWDLGPTGNDQATVTGELELSSTWTLQLQDAGGSADPADEFTLFTYTTTRTGGFGYNITLSPDLIPDAWDISGATIVDDGAGRVYLTGLSVAPTLVWDGDDGNWSDIAHAPNSHWLQGGALTPNIPTLADPTRVQSGKATVAASGQQTLGLLINGGEVNVAATGGLTVATFVNVDPGATLNVSGALDAPTINTAGSTSFNAGANVSTSTVNVSAGTFNSAAPVSIPSVNVSGGAANLNGTADMTVDTLNLSGGTVDAGANRVTVNGSMTLGAPGLYSSTYTATSGPFHVSGMVDVNRPETVVLGGPGTVLSVSNTRGTLLQAAVGTPGNPNPAGSLAEAPPGTYTIEGGGSDIWDTADHFYFVYQPFGGDGEMIARVSDPTQTNGWAKAGIMFRESLDAGSKNTFIARTPTGGENRITFQDRSSDGGGSGSDHTNGFLDPFYWLRIERQGDTFSGWWAPDVGGMPGTWQQMGTDQTVSMATDVLLGLAVTAHDNGELSTAVFDNVTGFTFGSLPTQLMNLTGEGTIVGDISIAGALGPGDGPGSLIADGNVVLEDGSVYAWELGDLTEVLGDLQLDSTWTLEIHDAGGFVADFDEKLDLFTYAGALGFDPSDPNAYSIDTSNLELGPDPGQWQIDPVNGLMIDFEVDGAGLGHVFLTGLAGGAGAQAIPEPSTLVLAVLGALGVLVWRRRRGKG